MAVVAPFPALKTGQLPHLRIGDGRGNHLAINRDAFVGNVLATRALVGDHVSILQVVKGDGYGLGLETVVALGRAAGIDGFCAGTPEEATRIRVAAPDALVLLFTATVPPYLPQLAAQGVTLSINSIEAFDALVISGVACRIYVELDCGFGRFGFDGSALQTMLHRHGLAQQITIAGAYTHFGRSDVVFERGLRLFDANVETIRACVRTPIQTMVAASHTILEYGPLPYDAVDPGRLLYGLVEPSRAKQFRPVLAELGSHVIQINSIAQARTITIGYGEEVTLPAGGKTGVFPLGWYDGLSLRGSLGEVLFGGRRVPVVARTLLHSVVDLSALETADVGDQVILIGMQGSERLSIDEVAAAQGMSATELHFKLAGSISAWRDQPGARRY